MRRLAEARTDAAATAQMPMACRSAAGRRASEAIRRAGERGRTSASSIIGGPYDADRARRNARAARTIFVCRPDTPAQEPACARTILTNLAHRAFRRPVTSADIQPLYAFYRRAARIAVARWPAFRERNPGRDRGHARVAGVSVPHRAAIRQARPGESVHRDQRHRARVAALVLPVELDSRRGAARCSPSAAG